MSKIAATETVNALFRFIDARDATAVAGLLTDDAAMADEMDTRPELCDRRSEDFNHCVDVADA